MPKLAVGLTVQVPDQNRLTMDCARCGTRDARAEMLEMPKGGHSDHFALVRCGTCLESSAVNVRLPGSDQWQITAIYPIAPPGGVVEYAPDGIADLIGEGYICKSAGAIVAGTMVTRAAVQAIARDKGVSGKSLKEEIDALVDQFRLPQWLGEAAHDIRALGNEAAHQGATYADDATIGALSDLLEFTVQLVHHLYESPRRGEKLRRRIEERKAASTEAD